MVRRLDYGRARFTTFELKTDFPGTAGERERVFGRARAAHLVRSAQVWNADVTNLASERTIELFRRTQMIPCRA